jgi:hypothetical protein
VGDGGWGGGAREVEDGRDVEGFLAGAAGSGAEGAEVFEEFDPVIAGDEDDGVVPCAGVAEFGDDPCDAVVETVDAAGVEGADEFLIARGEG